MLAVSLVSLNKNITKTPQEPDLDNGNVKAEKKVVEKICDAVHQHQVLGEMTRLRGSEHSDLSVLQMRLWLHSCILTNISESNRLFQPAV